MAKMKPRVLVVAGEYRLVQGSRRSCSWVEKRDGQDCMGVWRWRQLTSEDLAVRGCGVVCKIGFALGKNRDKRRRRAVK